jgi:DNA recombination protein RmuC
MKRAASMTASLDVLRGSVGLEEQMGELWLVAIGCLVGLCIGLIIALILRDRLRSSFESRVTETEKRAASADASLGELRLQIAQKGSEVDALRSKLEQEQKARTAGDTALQAEREKIEEEKKFLQEARDHLTDAFQALADEALKSNNRAFLDLAHQVLEKSRSEAVGDLEQRKEAIRGLVDPLAELLRQYEEGVRAIEGSRQEAYGNLKGLLNNVRETQENLQRETSNLVTALRRPQVRSRWGELTLRRVAELTGMVEHCDFHEQKTVAGEEARIRPDMVVHMPGELFVPVDSKVPLDAYLDAVAASTDDERKLCLARHARHVRDHIEQLASKAYWDQFEKTPEFTVLFLPGEPFFSAAAEYDARLIEDAIQNRVLIATPVTLVALLKAVAYGWKQEDIARNALEVRDLGKQLFERVSVLWSHLEDLRSALVNAVEAFNKTAGSLESRVLPSVRRFKELGVPAQAEIAELDPIDRAPRSLSPSPEAQASKDG